MKIRIVPTIIGLALSLGGLGAQAYAQDQSQEKPAKAEGHCEKKEGAKTVDIEAKDRADCKKKGGKWQKGEKHDHG